MTDTVVIDSVLDKEKHQRLIQDIDHIADTANIPTAAIHRSAVGFVSSSELDWLRHFNAYRTNKAGLVIVGEPESNPEDKCVAITAALVRNFIDARFMAVNSVLTAAEDGNLPEPTVLVIPNLFVCSAGGKNALPAYKIQTVYDVLVRRMALNRPSVLYIENLDQCNLAYGGFFVRHLKQNYKFSG